MYDTTLFSLPPSSLWLSILKCPLLKTEEQKIVQVLEFALTFGQVKTTVNWTFHVRSSWLIILGTGPSAHHLTEKGKTKFITVLIPQ